MPVNAEDVTLSWSAPQKMTDGSRLRAIKDLKEYRLYYGVNLDSIKDHVISINPAKNSLKLSMLHLSKRDFPLVYFAMSSVLKDGSESELSPYVFYLP